MGVTIKDIARLAGVSYSTVSKALNDSPLVRPDTKQKILDIANELGYQPNIAAKKLVSNQSKTIGVVWPTVNRVALSTIVTKLNEAVEAANYSMILSINDVTSAINLFKRFQVDGILVFETSHQILREGIDSQIPLTLIAVPDSPLPSIDVRRRDAIYKAVAYLHNLGHEKLAYVGHLPEQQDGQFEKYIGFTEALIRLGLNPRPEMFVNTEGLYVDHGYRAMHKLLQSGERPTAVIAGSYEITQGIIRATKEAGLRIPKDISLVGYDNIPQMEELEVPVTAVGASAETIANKAVDVLFKYIHDPKAQPTVASIEPEVNERKSCQPLYKVESE
ncbi:LacI family DNA-binding transcriptional regulator [Caldalkalibacillus salinus]|uniref:LacI family DNA-binding transcriptional regulator n=1 Tax=Caldalkalibacillus salinus TaxID=2803787 RepID=UPI001924690B|nr:LacI family DNA-binding transcriptional regulator [Caldalkalibacillus salinus]